MSRLLHIEASPRKDRSRSIRVANAFLKTYRDRNPGDEIQTVDLWSRDLPEIDGHTINAKYQILHGQNHDEAQAAAWQSVVDVVDEFRTADKFVFSVPMWNFGIPYRLKHYIDVIAQPGLTFSFDPESGYSGLVTGKPVAVVYARGGAYGNEAGQAMDFQKNYLDLLLGFLGFQDIKSVVVEPTLGGPDDVAAVEAQAISAAKSVAADF